MKLDTNVYESKSQQLSDIGWLLTISYGVTMGVYVARSLDEFASLSPNAIGDFLAGAAGPVAMFWLVLGFLQQRLELTQNTAALLQQAEEIAASVKQQEELVETTRRQLKHDEERHALSLKANIVPVASIERTRGDLVLIKVNLINLGYPCVLITSLHEDTRFEISGLPISHLEQFKPRSFDVQWENPYTEEGTVFHFRLAYTDAKANRLIERFALYLKLNEQGEYEVGAAALDKAQKE